MENAENGQTVKVHYTGKLEDGTVFDSSADRDPLQFTVGENHVISGFEKAVTGMTPGESKTVRIPSDEAYGPHRKELVLNVDRARFPEGVKPELSQRLKVSHADGRKSTVTVTEITESTVTLDANHPLAGRDLTFDIQLVEIC
jgi:FKBP-type peptidyl-prolyl cis-trans isomerase 2